MRISDWSSDVCSSDLRTGCGAGRVGRGAGRRGVSAQRRVLGAQCQLAALSALAHSDGGPLRRDAALKALAVGRAEIGSPSGDAVSSFKSSTCICISIVCLAVGQLADTPTTLSPLSPAWTYILRPPTHNPFPLTSVQTGRTWR